MGVNASNLGVTHYEDLPSEILQMVVAAMRKPIDDGTSWPKIGQVCKAWRRVAGTGFRLSVCEPVRHPTFRLRRRVCNKPENGMSRQGLGQPTVVLAVPQPSKAERLWAGQLEVSGTV